MRDRRHRRAIRILALALLLLGVAGPACAPAPDEGGVHVLTIDGAINPVVANYVDRGIDEADDAGATAVVIRIDTPGGLDTSMRDIVQDVNNANLPVITYVAPSGARAASAGTFITIAGHIAAMAPNTTLGAAHPVDAAGGDIEGDLGKKIENDAVAYIRGIAELRGRNPDWAEAAVRESVAVPENDAVQLDVVDLVAPTVEQLLQAVDGRSVQLHDGRMVTLQVSGAPLRANDMSFLEELLYLVSDPNIAYLLLSLGALGLVIELLNPGTLVPGIAGALALIVAFFSLGTLPVNWAGVALIMIAFGLLAAELFVPSFGALGIGGIVALALGGLILTTSDDPEFQVSRWVVLGIPAMIGALFAALALFVFSGRKVAIAVGTESLVGARGVARSRLEPEGFVFVRGERWRARAPRPVDAGERVVVTGIEGLRLDVTPAEDTAPEEAEQTPRSQEE